MSAIWNPWRRLSVGAVFLAVLAGCSGEKAGESFAERLSPLQLEGAGAESAWALFDRDTRTGWTPPADTSLLKVRLDRPAALAYLKVFGPSPFALTVRTGDGAPLNGLSSLRLDSLAPGWTAFPVNVPALSGELVLELTRVGGDGGLAEIELWAEGQPEAPVDERRLLTLGSKPPPGLDVVAAEAGPAVISPAGRCTQVRFTLTRSPASYRRAWIAYAADGAFRSFVLTRALNGGPPRLGTWFDAPAAGGPFVDAVDPEALARGGNAYQLCLPDGASATAIVHSARFIGELDQGTNVADRVARGPLDGTAAEDMSELLDPEGTTPHLVHAGERLVVAFDRWSSPDAVLLRRATGAWAVDCLDATGHVTALVPSAVRSDALQTLIAFAREGARECAALGLHPADGKDAFLTSLTVAASGTRSRVDWPKIVLASPPEHFGALAWVDGWVAAPGALGTATSVDVQREDAGASRGAFGKLLQRSSDPTHPWPVSISAHFSDGSEVARTFILESRGASLGPAGDGLTDEERAQRYGRPGDARTVTVDPKAEATAVRLGTEVGVDVPKGAVSSKLDITIKHLAAAEVPPLDPGMVNVTAPGAHAYEYLPHHQQFKQPVDVILPYDPQLLPPGYVAEDIRSYYYDTELLRWQPLARAKLDEPRRAVHSLSDHFTAMIDAVVVAPEHPELRQFDPNALSGIKAANPGAGIRLVEAPSANARGDASLSYPFDLPAGRRGLTPPLSLSYSSGRSNGWVGLGWDLPVGSISIDTRFGAARYDCQLESETYLLDGEQLSPVAHRGPEKHRSDDTTVIRGETVKVFHARLESAFHRIVRHGQGPKTYWWEVADKQGTRSFYGGTPEHHDPDDHAMLRTAAGDVFQWPLLETRDTHGNAVRYEYQQVSSAGFASGSVQGTTLYPKAIRYTFADGATTAPYEVTFAREARPDAVIDGRGGFKHVIAERLRRVEVRFQGQLVRAWELAYAGGAFHKSLLRSIQQIGASGAPFAAARHQFEYFDEIREPTPTGWDYRGFAPPQPWAAGDDDVHVFSIPPPAQGLLGNGQASVLGGSHGDRAGVHAYIGFNPTQPTKQNSFGGKVGFNANFGDTRLALIDLDGDGLPDKVFRGAGGIVYRHNASGPAGVPGFVPSAQPLPDLPSLGSHRAMTLSFGLEAYPTVFSVLFNAAATFSTEDTYFADVNGDGLQDLVEPGTVLFNVPTAAGPRFAPNDSGQTPFPILAGAVDPGGLVPDYGADDAQNAQRFPLVDAVRRWVAPYDGTVQITGPVQLLPSSPQGDGVRAAIQQNGAELWSVTIAPWDTAAKAPAGVSAVQVRAGDRLYFRLSALSDARDHIADWNPAIEYTGRSALVDANGRDERRFRASSDFSLGGRDGLFVTAPFDGQLRLAGTVTKAATTDDVTLRVLRGSAVVLDVVRTDTSTQPFAIDQTFAVRAGDRLEVLFRADSPVDLAALGWSPDTALRWRYVSATDAGGRPITVADQGRPLFDMPAPFDMDTYGVRVPAVEQPVYVAPANGALRIRAPVLAASGTEVTFTVKKGGSRLVKSVFLAGGGTYDTSIAVKKGDQLYFDFSTREQDPAALAVLRAQASVTYDPKSGYSVVPSLLHLQGRKDRCSRPYRGWSYAGLNGNKVGPGSVIPDGQLCVETSSFGSGASVPEDVEGAKAQGQQVNDETLTFALVPFPAGRPCQPSAPACDLPQGPAWGGADEELFFLPGAASAARHGANDISSPTGAAVAHGPTVSRMSRTVQLAESAGAGVGGISGSISNSNGQTEGVVDYLDMNGDGFPDVVGAGGIQYTGARGTLGTGISCRSPAPSGSPRQSTTSAQSIGIGGTVAQECGNSRGRAGATGTGAGGEAGNRSQMVSVGISLSGNWGHADTAYDLMDVNGDGLPDRVAPAGGALTVQLNVGYEFLPPETIAAGALNVGSSQETTVGGELGYNDGIYGFGGGFSAERGETRVQPYLPIQPPGQTLADINGDGLLDRVVPDGDAFQVEINTGSGLAPPVAWRGVPWPHEVTQSANLSVGGGLFFTIGIGPLCEVGCYLIINPGADYSASMERQEVAIRDIDGDGYPDHLFSGGSDQLSVARSLVGKTNLLKKVVRPMGATVELEYEREGNTFDQPRSQWVLSRVVTFDGVQGDWRASNPGADYQLSTFRYAGGRYDRREREFYGYAQVDSTVHDTRGLQGGVPAGFSKPYLRTTRVFRNDSFFTRGLLVSETVEGVDTAAPRGFSRSDQEYVLREVGTGRELATPEALAATLSPVFPELRVTVKRRAEGDLGGAVQTRVEQTYDADGNVVRVVDTGDAGPEDDAVTTVTYAGHGGANAACAAPHITGVADSISVTDGAGALLRRRESRLDCATGDVLELRQTTAAGGSVAVSQFAYTPEGNVLVATGPANLHGQRYEQHFSYDVPTRSHVTAVSDSFGYSSTTDYDLRFGTIAREVDANGQSITSSYDDFGRRVEVVGPYQAGTGMATIRFEYHPGDAVPFARTAHLDVYRDAADPIETVLFADGLGRVLQTKKDATLHQGRSSAAADVMTVSGCVAFDHAGRTFETYYPTVEARGPANDAFNPACDAKAPPTRKALDVLGRAVLTTLPDGTSHRADFAISTDRHGLRRFATTATDAGGGKTVTYRDIRDRVLAVQQFNATRSEVIWTEYGYDAADQLTAVRDDRGNLTAVTYDVAGRTVGVDNPDSGRVEMAYDAAGNQVRKVTSTLRAQSKAITYDYDFNRVKAIHYPSSPLDDVTYAYGAASMRGQPGNVAGRVTQVTDSSGSEVRAYGKLGELVLQTRTVASKTQGESDQSPEVWTTRYVYDTWGRLQQLTYPDGEVLAYAYDSGGLVRAALGTKLGVTTPYVQRLEYDEFGERAYLLVGNGVESTFAHDARSRRLSRLSAGDFQDLRYGYDPVGNVTALSNQVPIPSPRDMGGPVDQTFQYDGLYRLTAAAGEWRYAPNKRDSYSLAMTYDTIQNITRKAQAHDVTTPGGATVPQRKTTYDARYAYSGGRPHAATQVGERAYSYDRNGNQEGWEELTSGRRRTIDWDDENRIRAVHDNGRTTAFAYDDGGERVIKRGAQGETAYVNQFWTVRNRTVGTKHVFVGETRIASKVVPGSAHVDPGTGDPFAGVLGQWWRHRSEQGWQHGQNTVKNPHYAGNAMPDLLPEDNFVYFYHPDQLGSSSYATGPTGDLYEHLEYFPFGETWVSEQSNTERLPYLFTGKELDQETGLYYFGARYYDPQTSVWQSADPALGDFLAEKRGGEAEGGQCRQVYNPAVLALYTYAHQNPELLVDPDGRDPKFPPQIPPVRFGDGSRLTFELGGTPAVNYIFPTGGQIGLSYDIGSFARLGTRGPGGGMTVGFNPQTTQGQFQLQLQPTSLIRVSFEATTPGRDDSGTPAIGLGLSIGREPRAPAFTIIDTVNRGGRALTGLVSQARELMGDPVRFAGAHHDEFGAVGSAFSAVRGVTGPPPGPGEVRARFGITYGPRRMGPMTIVPELRLELRLEIPFDF